MSRFLYRDPAKPHCELQPMTQSKPFELSSIDSLFIAEFCLNPVKYKRINGPRLIH